MALKPIYLVRLAVKNPEMDAKFRAWYNGVHLPDLLKVPGVVKDARFDLIKGDIASLAIYEFPSVDAMMEGKNSDELAKAKADTQARWGSYLDPRGERYWCDVLEVYECRRDGLLDSGTSFVAYSTRDDSMASKYIVGELLPELRRFGLSTAVLYKVLYKDPESLPDRILMLQFKSEDIKALVAGIDGVISRARSVGLFEKLTIAHYDFAVSYTRNPPG
ncbi:DUF4286 family protein [Conexivisphaera calida]|uniref:EthD domain-containing protein n=1 Tax=Conexivisphaera calida TaxID=1874277 RepID=A0A4P2VAE6_9ARCH|nr:DUF4286 family protein [Conexivisphaera calida]BBE41444.1 hypothetical protein NAS2_0029 [Conexivisphaera calida]